MKNMAHVWIVTVIGALGGAALLGSFVAASEKDMRSGALAGDSGIGLWLVLTNDGHTKWLPWLIGFILSGVLCFALARTSLQTRRWREANEAETAAVAHPMD